MTLTVGVILTRSSHCPPPPPELPSYVCCNLPAMLVMLLDPTGAEAPKAHLPTYVLLWCSGVVNPVVYLVFNPLYR